MESVGTDPVGDVGIHFRKTHGYCRTRFSSNITCVTCDMCMFSCLGRVELEGQANFEENRGI